MVIAASDIAIIRAWAVERGLAVLVRSCDRIGIALESSTDPRHVSMMETARREAGELDTFVEERRGREWVMV